MRFKNKLSAGLLSGSLLLSGVTSTSSMAVTSLSSGALAGNIAYHLKLAKVELRKKSLSLELNEQQKALGLEERKSIAKDMYRDAVYGNPERKAKTGAIVAGATALSIPLAVGAYKSKTVSDAIKSGATTVGGYLFANEFTVIATVYTGIFAAIYGGVKYYSALSNGYNAWTELSEGRVYTNLEELQISYLANKHLLNSKLKASIEKQFIKVDEDDSKLIEVTTFIENALALPLYTKGDVTYDVDAVSTNLASYSDNVRGHLQNYAFELSLTNPEASSAVMFFHGLPGTGKTLAGKLVGKALDLPVATISLAGKSVEDLVGSSFESGKPNPGALIKAMIDSGKSQASKGEKSYKNMILVLDDFDRILNGQDEKSRATLAYMLYLLDPNNGHKVSSSYFETDVELPRHIILTGNTHIRDLALRRRFNNIAFDGFSAEVKKQIIWSHQIPAVLSKYSGSDTDGILVDSCTQTAISKLVEADKDPGFRTINILVEDFIKESLRNNMITGSYQTSSLMTKYLRRLDDLNSENLEAAGQYK